MSRYPGQRSAYTVADSGERAELGGGMVRDTEKGKLDPTLVFDGPMFGRWVDHLTKGAVKYDARNWMLAAKGTPEERSKAIERFQRSAARHFLQYLGVLPPTKDPDTGEDIIEDHAAAVFFNINGAEYLVNLESGLEPEDASQHALSDLAADGWWGVVNQSGLVPHWHRWWQGTHTGHTAFHRYGLKNHEDLDAVDAVFGSWEPPKPTPTLDELQAAYPKTVFHERARQSRVEWHDGDLQSRPHFHTGRDGRFETTFVEELPSRG